MAGVFINRIGTAVPAHNIHRDFTAYAARRLEPRAAALFARMAGRAGIEHRHSVLAPGALATGGADAQEFYRPGGFPDTAARMAVFEREATALALRAVADAAIDPAAITHLIVASCTGFAAPGLDLHLAARLGLRADLQRTLVGFMGCSAAVPALRLARQTVLAEPGAVVLVVNLELCTLHLQETADLETALTFLLFGDGCAAAVVSGAPQGLALHDFRSATIPDTAELITWRIGAQGFLMHLAGAVPAAIAAALRAAREGRDAAGLLRGDAIDAIGDWAVHAGGRSVLDAVEAGLGLPGEALAASRAVLAAHGNMSSATVLFVLRRLLDAGGPAGRRGMAMAFGPGMVAETFRFSRV
ncbi:MAG TPA: type III polyketide synthase [Acidiphilium sp.]|nr:type III polyketide synthase [Acidiphilium sp.]